MPDVLKKPENVLKTAHARRNGSTFQASQVRPGSVEEPRTVQVHALKDLTAIGPRRPSKFPLLSV